MNGNKKLLIFVVALNFIYIVWLTFHFVGFPGFVFYIAEISISSLAFVFLINHWTQEHVSSAQYKALGAADVFIPVVDEPIALFERVLKAAVNISYRYKRVCVLDDGHREIVRALCDKYRARYLSRPDHLNHSKAGNLNYGLAHSKGDFILVLDADQVADKNILKDLLGLFSANRNVAIVSTKQSFNLSPHDFNHDRLFYDHMQAGKSIDNAAISCGSGVIYLRRALESIGGFSIWNVVEDVHTSYVLHVAGYESIYVDRAYSSGTAPQDLKAIYQQRGTWALDTLRLFFKDNPFFKKQLSLKQKLHYTELALAYVVSALAVPVLFVFPIAALLLDYHFIDSGAQYVLFRVPSLVAVLFLYYRLSGNTFSVSQFWASLSFVYLKALILSLMPGKPKYQVTPKTNGNSMELTLIIPHLFLMFAAVAAALFYLISFGADSFLAGNLIWIALMFFWFYPVVLRGFAITKKYGSGSRIKLMDANPAYNKVRVLARHTRLNV